MKIWKEFNSSHSSNISIVGKFADIENAKKAFKIIEDFTLASWEERYPSIKEFTEYWSVHFSSEIPYWGLTQGDFNTGVGNDPHVEIRGNEIRISRFQTTNIGGIAKLMLLTGAKNVLVENEG